MLRIESTDPQGSDALGLLREAAIEASLLYPELHRPDLPWPTNPPLPERAAYLIAYRDDEPIACGALRPIDESMAEVRRMFVRRSERRAGVARAVLSHLEARARALGYQVLRLETGSRQQAAMALYASCGFTVISPFGEYADDPLSICYEKTLDAGEPG